MRAICLSLAILLCPVGVSAQDRKVRDTAAWPQDRQVIAQRVSDVLAVSSLVLPCLVDDRHADCWQDQAIRTGIVLGATEIAKRLVKRTRPDGSDRKSFYSMHTALTCVSAMNRTDSRAQWWGAALCGAVGYLRIAGDKHWFTDVLVGGGVGATVALSWGR